MGRNSLRKRHRGHTRAGGVLPPSRSPKLEELIGQFMSLPTSHQRNGKGHKILRKIGCKRGMLLRVAKALRKGHKVGKSINWRPGKSLSILEPGQFANAA